jgi:hypothetical protein
VGEPLHVPHFGGGVVLAGSADARQVTELERADGIDLTDTGSVTQASDLTDYLQLRDLQGTPDDWAEVLGIHPYSWVDDEQIVAVGVGDNAGGSARYLVARFAPSGETTPLSAAKVYDDSTGNVADDPYGIVTFAAFPYVDVNGDQLRPLLINIGARYDLGPTAAPGLYVLYENSGGTTILDPISEFDFLGTGNTATSAESHATGTSSEQGFFRGIASYNNHVFGWGFQKDGSSGADAPNRLMFSNIANPFKWGNDNVAASGDRIFTDSDAVIVGGGGERIMGALAWNDRLWLGTNRELHWLAGYGRDSFIKNGSAAIHKSENVVGPHAMCEGPDGLLYGCGSRGLWIYDGGATPDAVGRRLIQFGGRSPGFWDLMSSQTGIGLSHPNKRNTDLVWMASVPERRQVWVVIPYCNASAGFGLGGDSVIIKYHVDTGGFTRQVLTARPADHGCVVPKGFLPTPMLYMVGADLADADAGTTKAVQRYAFKATEDATPRLPFGNTLIQTVPYAPFGSEGVGTIRKVYVTLSWETSLSSLALSLTVLVDGQQVATPVVTVSPAAPVVVSDGDLWIDTAGTDTDLGNATAGTFVGASADYLLKRYVGSRSAWVKVPGGGWKERRATVPVAFNPVRGSRVQATISLPSAPASPGIDPGGRVQIESLGLTPTPVRAAA